MSKEEPKFWGIEGDEVLEHDNIADRLQEYVDYLDVGEKVPEEIEMVGFDPIKKFKDDDIQSISDYVLESTLEWLDENYSTCKDESTDPTERMVLAAKEFAKAIIEDYEPWDCEEVCRKTVKILDYLDKSDLPQD